METYRLIAPGDQLDWSRDWSGWLADADDRIARSTWTIAPAGPVLSSDTLDGAVASVIVAGCCAGRTYLLSNVIVTLAGRVASAGLVLRCEVPS